MKKNGKFTISIGELIDRISIINVKIWHAEEKFTRAKEENDKENMANIAVLTRELNRERASLREEINHCIEGKGRGSTKLNYLEASRK